MFGLFKKSASYPTESQWSVLQSEYEGRPMLVRRNDSAKQLRGHSEYDHRVGVAVPLRAPDDRGLPGNDEMIQLNAIEDLLSARLEANQGSLQVLAITAGGTREFVFYTRVASTLEPVLKSLQAEVSSHEIQCYIKPDPQWSVYGQFA